MTKIRKHPGKIGKLGITVEMKHTEKNGAFPYFFRSEIEEKYPNLIMMNKNAKNKQASGISRRSFWLETWCQKFSRCFNNWSSTSKFWISWLIYVKNLLCYFFHN